MHTIKHCGRFKKIRLVSPWCCSKFHRHPQNIPSRYTILRYFNSSHYHPTRLNPAKIQMLSPGLHDSIFQGVELKDVDQETLESVQEHLTRHGLWDKSSETLDDVTFPLPKLHGENIAEHFQGIAKKQSSSYFALAEHMANALTSVPRKPDKWRYAAGWTKYKADGTTVEVAVPEEEVLVFDVEVCLKAGNVPVLATAVSKKAWYCWVSEYLTDKSKESPTHITPSWMIPMEDIESTKEKLLIGHNVAFDRTYVKEQYNLKGTATRFLDTLSLHVCVSGVTNEQRNYMKSKNPVTYDWMDVGTTNSLEKVYDFYCNKKLDKAVRDYFTEGTLDDIRVNFQECVNYCASDVKATHEVFESIWPMFLQHVPHPVSFAGMLEMGRSYLPVNRSWIQYIEKSEEMYTKVTSELRESLMNVAEEVLAQLIDKRYQQNPWTWNLDWSLHKTAIPPEDSGEPPAYTKKDVHEFIKWNIQHLSDERISRLHMPGYPKWYRDLCIDLKGVENYRPRPYNISSQTKVTPSILRMTWDGYPLHHEKKFGWGYLAPTTNAQNMRRKYEFKEQSTGFPYRSFFKMIDARNGITMTTQQQQRDVVEEIYKDDVNEAKGIDIGVPGVRFYKLPHKNGNNFNVGNPLAKDFLSKIDEGTLATNGDFNAKLPIELNKMMAFWRNGRKRIRDQLAVWLDPEEGDSNDVGVVLPRVITAGTVTRRAVEPTWLTASNPLPDRIGSELKSMVQAPPGYSLVGADVDSQELWIASILGDAQFAHMHGCTALSWMTLQGKKSERTDLHSKTADTIGMSRDQAKVFNYGRVYGAGEKFAVRLLMQFNHKLTFAQAEQKAKKLYETTKGVKKYRLTEQGRKLAEEMNVKVVGKDLIDYSNLKMMLYEVGLSWDTRHSIVHDHYVWHAGSESDMFNMLESIALSDAPRTPVLNCLITKALLPQYVHNHYKTSRVNWVVQSSAVDYLHLMLTCMRWLIDEYKIDARFCVSIHDEVRYIVSDKDRYRLALALQITNLLTRSMFAYKLNLNDLPQSVAFFSSVDIDRVLRKEVDMDCVTPSNPDGLSKGYGIQQGESLDIYSLLEKTNGGTMNDIP